MATTIKPIEARSIHQIQSGQVIVDLCSVVKELVENSLDAAANSIEVRFRNNGLDSVEVQDNGEGIAEANYERIGLKHYTSKLSSFDDISTLNTFGFRGEAVSSLCALSTVSITTAQAHEAPKGKRLEFETSGKLKSTHLTAAQKGTTVSVENLFENLPVRRKELAKNIKREYGKVVGLLHAYACISTGVKFSVKNSMPKSKTAVVFSTKGNEKTRENIANVYGAKMLSQLIELNLVLDHKPTLTHLHASQEDMIVHVKGHISRPVFGEGRQTPDRQMVFVNGRPCGLPQISKAINEVYKSFNVSQSPFIFADFQMNTNAYDVNISPDKRSIFLHNSAALTESLKTSLTELFDNTEQSVPHSQARGPDLRLSKNISKLAESAEADPSKGEVPKISGQPETMVDVIESDHVIVHSNEDAAQSENSNPPQSKHQGMTDPTQKSKDLVARAKAKQDEQGEQATSPSSTPTQHLVQLLPSIVKVGERAPDRLHHLDVEEGFEHIRQQQYAAEKDTTRDLNAPLVGERERESPVSHSRAPGAEEEQRRPWKLHQKRDDQAQAVIDVFHRARLNESTFTNTNATVIAAYDRSVQPLRNITSPQLLKGKSSPLALRSETPNILSDSSHSQTSQMSPGSPVDGTDIGGEIEEDEGSLASDNDSPSTAMDNSGNTVGLTGYDEPNLNGGKTAQASYTDDLPSRERDGDSHGESGNDQTVVLQLIQHAENSASSSSIKGIRKRTNQALNVTSDKNTTVNILTNLNLSYAQVLEQYHTSKRYGAVTEQSMSGSLRKEASMDASDEERLALTISKDDFAKMHIAGQFNLGFIVAVRVKDVFDKARQRDEVFIVDQHASDEKYNFERLQAETVVSNQRLVHPIRLELTAVEEEIVLENMEALKKNGFILECDLSGEEPVGQRCKLVNLPLSKEVVFGEKDLEELIHLLSETHISAESSYIPRPSKVRKMFAMRACRSSIMIGKTLSQRQMSRVLHHMGTIDKPWNCPHGRPTMRHLASLDEFDTQLWQEGDGVCSGEPEQEMPKTPDIWKQYIS